MFADHNTTQHGHEPHSEHADAVRQGRAQGPRPRRARRRRFKREWRTVSSFRFYIKAVLQGTLVPQGLGLPLLRL